MMKKKLSILILVFISTISIFFTVFFVNATNENHGKIKFYFEVSFDARISSDNLFGNLSKSDGTIGKEVHIPIQTEVHVIAVKKNGDVRIETPIIINIEGESREVFFDYSLGYISMENIDKSSYAKELLQSKVQENEQGIDLKIKKYFVISVIAALIAFAVFSVVFLSIEKKCNTGRKYKILFRCLLFTAIMSFFIMMICIQYMRGIR